MAHAGLTDKVRYISISIPIELYNKLKEYSDKHNLTVRKCSKVLIEEAINVDLYARKLTKSYIEEITKI